MTMDESQAGLAYNDIVTALFGPDGFRSDAMPHQKVSKFVNQMCAHTWHRWRKAYNARRNRLKKAQVSADELYRSMARFSADRNSH